MLTKEHITHFGRDGFLTPVAVFDQNEVGELRRQFEAFEDRLGPEQAPARRTDLHLLQVGGACRVFAFPAAISLMVLVVGAKTGCGGSSPRLSTVRHHS